MGSAICKDNENTRSSFVILEN